MRAEFDRYGSPAVRLMEELAELSVALAKVERFGLDDANPLVPAAIPNRRRAEGEISDVVRAIDAYLRWAKSVPVGSHVLTDYAGDGISKREEGR